MQSQTVRGGVVALLICCSVGFGYSLGWQRGNFAARNDFDHRLNEITRQTFTRLDRSLHASPASDAMLAERGDAPSAP